MFATGGGFDKGRMMAGIDMNETSWHMKGVFHSTQHMLPCTLRKTLAQEVECLRGKARRTDIREHRNMWQAVCST
jgi:hypothetical protein